MCVLELAKIEARELRRKLRRRDEFLKAKGLVQEFYDYDKEKH